MKQLLLICAVVALVGCGKKAEPLPAPHTPEAEPKTAQAVEAETQVTSEPSPEPSPEPDPVPPAEEKLIANPNIEWAIRTSLEKPEGKLTETDLARVTELHLGYIEITDEGLKLNEVAKMKQPATINLSYTPITDASLKELAKLQKLTHLSLDGT